MENPTDMDVTNGTQQLDLNTDAANIDSVPDDFHRFTAPETAPETATSGPPESITEPPSESTTEQLLESTTGETLESDTDEAIESDTEETREPTEEPLESVAEEPQESIDEESPESDIEDLFVDKTLEEQSTMEKSDDLTSHTDTVSQGEQQTAELSEDLDDQISTIEDSEEPTLDADIIDQIQQQTVQDSESPDLDAEMADHDELETIAHPGAPATENEMYEKDEQETIMRSIEEGFDQVPDSSAEVEVDATTVELTEDPQESQHRDDSPSLFVTGRSPSVQPAAQIPPSVLPTSVSRPIMSGTSTFARIRNLQQRIQRKRNAGMQDSRSMARQHQPTPDPETFLESIISPRTRGLGAESSVVADDTDNEDRMAEKEDQKAVENYKKAKEHYDSLRHANNGSLTFRQDVEWLKIQGAEETRRKKRKRDQARAHAEQGLFPDVTDNGETNGFNHGDESGSDTQQGTRKRQRPELPQKQPRKWTIKDAERRSMMVALEANGDMPKKKKKSQQADSNDSRETRGSVQKQVSKSKSSRASKSKASGKKLVKAPRKNAKEKRNAQDAVRQVTSLFTSNVFEQQARQDAPDQPTFRSRNKQDALKELIASVPLNDKTAVRNDAKHLMQATKDFDGRGSVKSDGNGMWLVKGMKTSLKPYQLLGSAFMRRRENAIEEPRGGLVADQMGLGKTLMMLANIVNGRRPKGEQGPRTTLLVAGQNLLNQWKKEIITHTDGTLNLMTYSSGNRIDSNCCFEILKGHDIILTTYTEIMRSYPKNEPPITCQTTEDKIDWWKNVYEKQRGVLHRMIFQRIVLDEAQAIKNHTSRTSIACRALMAEHRWALSGTPILNALTELYPYFKFLNVPHTGTFKIFKNNYCDAADVENTERLLVRLAQFMIRRTHADVMFGAPILKLPKADQATLWCSFNPIERNIYDIVQRRFAKRINTWAKRGELDRSYSNALVMLLRLRQLTAHVLMLQFVMEDLLEREDIERIREVVEEASSNHHNNPQIIIAVRKQLDALAAEEKKKPEEKLKAAAKKPMHNRNGSAEDDAATHDDQTQKEDEDIDFQSGSHRQPNRVRSGRAFGKEYDFNPYLKSLTTGESWEKAKERATCGSCGFQPVQPHKTTCGHLYCLTCYEVIMLTAAESGPDEPIICKKCGKASGGAIPCDEEEEDDLAGPQTRAGKKKRAEKERVRMDREDIRDDWLSLGTGGGVLPSAKTIAIKAQILNWIQENPKVKIIVYTQFLPMIRILAKICEEEGWPTEQYHGKLNYAGRDKAITSFGDEPHIRILLASLRCGGLGLNLTMASRVIVVDPWWNNASEQQAFCRVFRIGQNETTFMTRFCVKDTVDKRLIEMQEHKQEEIDSVMEDQGETVKKMGIKDLMRLFGNLDEDKNGRPFIVVDNPDPRGSFRADRDDEGYAQDD